MPCTRLPHPDEVRPRTRSGGASKDAQRSGKAKPGQDAAIKADEAARLLAPLGAARSLLLAVSGGPDSMALMLLAAAWGRAPGRPPIAVATVDHGLRLESRAEAEAVGGWADALGLPHRVLIWQGTKPRTRIHERAREARYDLLSIEAVRVGASHIALAHHADDQAETVLFRLIRGSGPAGLAGMAALTHRRGLVLARPFLGVPKARLLATCTAAGQAFFDDPSNADERFARARLRRLMPLLAEAGLDREALVRLARRAATAEEALRRVASERAAELCRAPVRGGLAVDLTPLRSQPPEIVSRVLQGLIEEVKDETAPVRLDRLEQFLDRLLPALNERGALKDTLAGTIVTLDHQGKVVITRETTRRRGRSSSR